MKERWIEIVTSTVLGVFYFGYLPMNGYFFNFNIFIKFFSPFSSVPKNQKDEYIASKKETVVKNYLSASKQNNNDKLGGNNVRKLIDGNFFNFY